MKIVVVGPGAMGCLFAARLVAVGNEVVLLDKEPSRAAALARSGIRVDDKDGTQQVGVPVTADPATLKAGDCVLVLTKAYDTAAGIRWAAPAVGAETAVLSLQNGLGNGEQIAELVPRRQILLGTTGQSATTLSPGHIQHAGTGPSLLGAFGDRAGSKAEPVAAMLSRAGIPTEAVTPVETALWSKLVVNAAVNPLSAIADVPNGALVRQPKLRDRLRRAAAETAAVAEAAGIPLTYAYASADAEAEAQCERSEANISSMLQDVRAGRRTEIEAINGAVVRKARLLGLDVPENESMLTQIRALEAHGPNPTEGERIP